MKGTLNEPLSLGILLMEPILCNKPSRRLRNGGCTHRVILCEWSAIVCMQAATDSPVSFEQFPILLPGVRHKLGYRWAASIASTGTFVSMAFRLTFRVATCGSHRNDVKTTIVFVGR